LEAVQGKAVEEERYWPVALLDVRNAAEARLDELSRRVENVTASSEPARSRTSHPMACGSRD
jgi:hypothetical protein